MDTTPLNKYDFSKAALELGCEPEVVMAIAEVETGWRPGKTGFLTVPASRWKPSHVAPIILFEPHVFHRETGGRFSKTHPHLSYAKWRTGAYGASSTQHHKLQEAALLDREAALKSCSWGMFQLMGFNWKMMGYTNLQDFVTEMYASNRAQLDGFMRFIKAAGLQAHLRSRNWAAIARVYNGAGYATHGYHTKMAAAYKRLKGSK